MTIARSVRAGLTLVELLVVLVLLALGAGLVAAGPVSGRRESAAIDAREVVAQARRDAIRSGRITIRVRPSPSGFVIRIAAYPTGMVLVDSAIAVHSDDSTDEGAAHDASR